MPITFEKIAHLVLCTGYYHLIKPCAHNQYYAPQPLPNHAYSNKKPVGLATGFFIWLKTKTA
ncbi:hypothetical protein A9308_03630 [Moraxella atlantae]|uniref:Uncharacterized protein n=1 Tax=Faucicola atlantae TaxID=34059 RepID=A0A1B8QFB7_9GAMM|nr:hypothetical protein A9308_03630 [Moraxella atlantae]